GQAAEEDAADRRHLRERPGRARGGQARPGNAGDFHRRQGQGERGRLLPWGEKAGLTPRGNSPRHGTMTRRRSRSGHPLEGWCWRTCGGQERSDVGAGGWMRWGRRARGQWRHIGGWVIYMDTGPKTAGRRTQCLKRMIEFSDGSGLEIRLVSSPPYHSKYNPI